MEPIRRADCCGEVHLCRLVSRGITSLGNRHGVMTTIAYLTLFLLSPHLRRRCCLLIFGEDREREEVEVRGEKKEEEKVLTAFVVVVCRGCAASSSGEGTFRRHSCLPISALCLVTFVIITV